MLSNIPRPTIARLCKVYSLLEEMEEKGEKHADNLLPNGEMDENLR